MWNVKYSALRFIFYALLPRYVIIPCLNKILEDYYIIQILGQIDFIEIEALSILIHDMYTSTSR